VFDEVRKKWTILSPEEWVRQHLLNFLIHHKNVPASLISIEKEIVLNATKKRYDVVVYNREMKPVLLAECKSRDVSIDQNTLEQALRYNLILGVRYLLITNGLKDFPIKVENGKGSLLEQLPDYTEIT